MYVNKRQGATYKKINIESDDVFEIFREYRESKANPNFNHVTAYVKKFSTSIISDFYVSLYYWKEGTASQNEDFLIPRHGNAKKTIAATYYRTDSQTINKAKTMLSENYSSSSIYDVKHEAKISVGQEITDPKQLWNLKQNLNKTKRESSSSSGEVDRIVAAMKLEQGKSFIHNVTILPQYYIVFAFTDDCLEGVERCCVNSSSVFRCDTTFEIMNKLWLTDTSYTNTTLIKTQDTKHPEFPGPMMVHFTKDQGTYQHLATEIVPAKPNLSNISTIAHDMGQAIKHGLTSIFSKAEGLVCLQHVSERDNKKLDKLLASTSDKKCILSDIQGSKKNRFLQFGLADAIDVS